MTDSFKKLLDGYVAFHNKYISSQNPIMELLHTNGQNPSILIVSCCDSRVDPALLFQCDPGDLFVVRNIANIIPPYEEDSLHHGISAALEYGINSLNIKHLIILGHSQCGGIKAWLDLKSGKTTSTPFVDKWVSIINIPHFEELSPDVCSILALHNSYSNCLTFPWIYDKVMQGVLIIHLWYFDIKTGEILVYAPETQKYNSLLESL